jgi:LysM repeat protein
MTTTRYLIFLVLVSLAIILAGCRLSASTPPPTETPTADAAMSTLEAELGNIATQTFVAGGGEATPAATQPPQVESTEPAAPDASPVPTEQVTEPPAPAQPSATPVVVPTATPGIPTSYQLQKSEFPFCIARRFNVNQSELLSLNGLSTSSVVPVGFTLKIPQTGNTFAGQRSLANHPDSYTVVAGDTIYKVACKYGDVDPMAIAQANGLSSPYNLSSGQVLQIP